MKLEKGVTIFCGKHWRGEIPDDLVAKNKGLSEAIEKANAAVMDRDKKPEENKHKLMPMKKIVE